jgi:short-subunit dehydrogenase
LESNSLDLLINAVGRSDRGMLCDLKEEDLLDQIRVNVLSTFRMTRACWSSLERGHGCIINIASLAGIVAGPGLGGYPLAKHALVAMHRQWRSEAVGSGVHFLLVCPGPIDRNDSLDRYADLVAERGLDQQRARPGGGVKLERLDPTQLSARILNAAERRELELVVPGKVKWLAALMPLWPRWADSILRKKF